MNTAELRLEHDLNNRYYLHKKERNDANRFLAHCVTDQRLTPFLDKITPEHLLYAVALTPKVNDCTQEKLFTSQRESEIYLEHLQSNLLHHIHRMLHNHYRRKSVESKLIQTFHAVESEKKTHDDRVPPHVHACFAVHPHFHENFQNILKQHPDPDPKALSGVSPSEQFTIDFSHFKNQKSADELQSKIRPLHVTPLKREHLYNYADYCFKEEFHELKLKKREKCL
jgi:hypothetical protein